MLNYACPRSVIITSSAQRVYNNHWDCCCFFLYRHFPDPYTLVHKQTPMGSQGSQLSRDPPEKCTRDRTAIGQPPPPGVPCELISPNHSHFPMSTLQSPSIPALPHTNYILHQDLTDSVHVYMCVCMSVYVF